MELLCFRSSSIILSLLLGLALGVGAMSSGLGVRVALVVESQHEQDCRCDELVSCLSVR
jgi:hypothetical protein